VFCVLAVTASGIVAGDAVMERLRPAPAERKPGGGIPWRPALQSADAPTPQLVPVVSRQHPDAAAPTLEAAVARTFEVPLAEIPTGTAAPATVPPSTVDPTTSATAAADDGLGGETTRVVVRRGDTLLDILGRVGIGAAEAHAALTGLRAVYDPRTLRPGQALEIGIGPATGSGDTTLASLSLDVDPTSAIALTREDDGTFKAEPVDRDLDHHLALAAGTIERSLYVSASRTGMPAATIADFIKIFSWDVDFQRDLHPGDRFEAVIEEARDQHGRTVGAGRIRFASLTVDGKLLRAYRHERADGTSEYLDATGRPLRKWLLRTPIDGARLSSAFGMRHHPILGYSRMHKGVDFAAPTGTPIYAAGDGIVEFEGLKHGYGKYVSLRHNKDYDTAYAHMSRLAKGLQRGSRVVQGQVIGYVGATGLATGPHLHYEVVKDGTPINPLALKTIMADPLGGAGLLAFEAERTSTDRERSALEHERQLAER
jgi:murein DD-endopeptidase MepM/ murein hydrolase activator NlpD